jgi:hypothetical protein
MKYILIVLPLTIFSLLACKAQVKKDNIKIENDCFSQENMRKVYVGLKELILQNAKPEEFAEAIFESGETEPYHTGTNFQYDNVSFVHQYVPNKQKDFPKFNMETISIISEGISYMLIYGGHLGDSSVSIEIKDYPEEMGKQIQQKANQHFCNVICKNEF